MQNKLSNIKPFTRRDFIKTSGTISVGITVFPGIFSGCRQVPGNLLGNPDPVEFMNPGTAHRGVAFLFFNDDIKPEEAVRQLKVMHQAGWGKVLPRRYGGLLNPTYGKAWNTAVREVIKTAKELNMKVFLQEADKNGWYSAAPTEIPGMKDEYRNKFLIKRDAGERPDEHEILVLNKGDYSYYQHTAYPRKGWENSFCYLDILDQGTVNSYLTALFSFLDNEFGDEMGKTIEAIWVAEPHMTMGNPRSHDTLPWTPGLDEIFRADWGYFLIDNIPKLFDDIGDFQKVRYHYWRTLSDLILRSYSEVMQQWCNKYQLKFTGHLMGEDSFISQLQYSVNIMPHFEYMDIPGIDHLTMDTRWPTGDPFIHTPKMASSVANQLGKKEVLSEMYGCSDLGNSFEDRKNVFQWLAIMGINYRNYHGAFYSMRGERKRKYPVNLNYQQPYWDKNRFIADYAARLSYLIKQGKYKADILVLNSIESYYPEGKIGRKLSKEIVPLQQNLIDLSHNLLKIHRDFDYGDETILSKYGATKKNYLIVGEMAYKVIILPSVITLRKTTLELFNNFLDAGGTILSTGDLPVTIDGEANAATEEFNKKLIKVNNTTDALQYALDQITSPAIRIHTSEGYPAEPVWVHSRITDNGLLFYMANTDATKSIDAEILLQGKGSIERWNLENGNIEPIPQKTKEDIIQTKYRFAPGSSLVLFLDNTKSQTDIPFITEQAVSKIPVNNFTVGRKDANALTLDFCRFSKDGIQWSDIYPVLGVQDILTQENYSGTVSLQFEFTSEITPERCAVVIEEADQYGIMINGNEVKYNNAPYYRDISFLPVDITSFVKKGKNIIQLTRNFESADKDNIDNKNLNKFYGTELEQIYLTGDFAVVGEKTGEDFFECKRERFTPSFILTKETKETDGNLLLDGYCFFNGTLSLNAEVDISPKDETRKYYLEMEDLQTVTAEIKVNGKTAGIIAWKPYRLELTGFIDQGTNNVEIILTNSLRNLMGSLHYLPLKDATGGQWSQKATPSVGDGSRWYENRNDNKYWSDDYFFRSFGVEKVSVVSNDVES
ncbi:MAG: glycosyl hydrolase [Mariniphaga sp.]|nr:glycosyl hydrolase [Mariniphaga sp.]